MRVFFPLTPRLVLQKYLSELSRLSRLALPLVFTQLAQMSMSVADTMMAGRVNSVELAGVALGTVVYWPIMLLVSGTMMSITPSVAQLNGARRGSEAGEVVRQAFWIALVGGACLIFAYRNLTPLYEFVGVDAAAIPVTSAYLHAMSFGVVPVLCYFCMRYLCEGMGWTIPALAITISALLLKIPLNYWFIYGGWGVPGMGGEGCGWASVVVFCYQAAAIAMVVRFSRIRHCGLFSRFSWPDFAAIRRLVALGAPIGLSTFAEYSVFSTLTLLIGRLGVDKVAAHQIASNIGGLTFMIPLALGMAASIRVGFNVGAADFEAARRSGAVALGTSFAFALMAALVLVLGNEFIAGLYTTEAGVLTLAAELLILVAIYQPFDDVQGTAIGALRGFKDTRTPFFVAVCAYWFVGFPLSWALGFGYFERFDYGVYGYWVGLILGLAVASVVLVGRFAWLSRRTDRIRQLALR
jgi:MATE family multidrug resistance protein